MSGRPATTRDETPVFFAADGHELFGIMTHPPAVANHTGVVLLSGGGRLEAGGTPSLGRNRIWVRLARTLAADGYHALRLDYHGVGESSGATPRYRLQHPFVADVQAATGLLEEHGIRHVVLMGACFGGRSALAAAPTLATVSGVALFGSPFRDYDKGALLESMPWSWFLRKVLSPRVLVGLLQRGRRRTYVRAAAGKLRSLTRPTADPRRPEARRSQWVSAAVLAGIGALVDRGVPLLWVLGEADASYVDYCKAQQEGPLRDLLDRAGEIVRVMVVPGKVHGLPSSECQQLVMDVATTWLQELPALQKPAVARAGAADGS